jgi:hypothetical protein
VSTRDSYRSPGALDYTSIPMIPSLGRQAARVALLSVVLTASLSAQKRRVAAKAAVAETPLVGTWTGKATVQLGDSAIVVPVSYTFQQTGSAIGGTAMVPGQGVGPISNVVRDGQRLRFLVTAPEKKLLNHDGVIGADGAIEGMVMLEQQPVAKFRVSPRPTTSPPK